MTKKLLIPLLAIVPVLAVSATAYALRDTSASRAAGGKDSVVSSPPVQSKDQAPKESQSLPSHESATLVGTVGCLQSANGDVQDLSCAIVLTQDDGKVYALNSQDPVAVGSLPGGQRVQVTGALSRQSAQDSVEATVNVQAIERL